MVFAVFSAVFGALGKAEKGCLINVLGTHPGKGSPLEDLD